MFAARARVVEPSGLLRGAAAEVQHGAVRRSLSNQERDRLTVQSSGGRQRDVVSQERTGDEARPAIKRHVPCEYGEQT